MPASDAVTVSSFTALDKSSLADAEKQLGICLLLGRAYSFIMELMMMKKVEES